MVPKNGEVALVLQPHDLVLGRHAAPLLATLPVVDGAETGLPGKLATCSKKKLKSIKKYEEYQKLSVSFILKDKHD